MHDPYDSMIIIYLEGKVRHPMTGLAVSAAISVTAAQQALSVKYSSRTQGAGFHHSYTIFTLP